MRSHASIGAEMPSSGALPVPAAACVIARHHRERGTVRAGLHP